VCNLLSSSGTLEHWVVARVSRGLEQGVHDSSFNGIIHLPRVVGLSGRLTESAPSDGSSGGGSEGSTSGTSGETDSNNVSSAISGDNEKRGCLLGTGVDVISSASASGSLVANLDGDVELSLGDLGDINGKSGEFRSDDSQGGLNLPLGGAVGDNNTSLVHEDNRNLVSKIGRTDEVDDGQDVSFSDINIAGIVTNGGSSGLLGKTDGDTVNKSSSKVSISLRSGDELQLRSLVDGTEGEGQGVLDGLKGGAVGVVIGDNDRETIDGLGGRSP
jgi:hypothetical protein